MSRRLLIIGLGLGLLARGGLARAAEPIEQAHFHHVELNVTDVKRSLGFYTKHFGATPVKFRGKADALFVERSFLLLNKVDKPAPAELKSALWHMGWGGVDMVNEYNWLKKQGVTFHTELSPLPGPNNFYMYISGPDKELIEINTMGHHRFAHIHLFADDVNATTDWYAKYLGIKSRRGKVPKPKGDPNTIFGIWLNVIQADNVSIIVFGKPDSDPPPKWWPDKPLREFEPTKGRAIDHFAFSYRKLEPAFERMKKDGVKIVSPIADRPQFGLKSFFVESPDKVLIEVVESKPIPEGIWED